MRRKGQITVFLSLILVCICSLICGLLESARTAGARYFLQAAADSAIDSVFSQYHRAVWDNYRLLFLEYDTEEEIKSEFTAFLKAYMEIDNWYPLKAETVEVQKLWSAEDGGGIYLEREVLDYMQYGIWNLDLDPVHAEELLGNLKEAGAVGEAAKVYGERTKDALRLEKALEKIEKSLDKQWEDKRIAASYLDSGDGPGFRREAERLKAEIRKLPKLVSAYERQADQLGGSLKLSRKKFSGLEKDLSSPVLDGLEEEISHYEEYTDKDGERRLEVIGLLGRSDQNVAVIDRAIEESEQAEEIIEAWEDSEDEEGDLDESSLWSAVQDILNRYELLKLSFSPGVKDKKKQGFLERIERMAGAGLLSMTLPEGVTASAGVIDRSGFPSVNIAGKETGHGNALNLVNRLLTDEYCIQFFTGYLSPEKKEVQYELEYLLGGRGTDKSNLEAAVKEILVMREGMNLVHILSSPQKRSEARALACTIAGVTGLAPLAAVLSFFIMSIWALGEAIVDVRGLLDGKKVPLFKTSETWNLSLDALLKMGEDGVCSSPNEKEGIDYNGYLRVLLFAKDPKEKYYRMMDMIQMNIRRKQDDFLMEHCAYSVEMDSEVLGRHMFFSLMLMRNQADGYFDYRMKVKAKKVY